MTAIETPIRKQEMRHALIHVQDLLGGLDMRYRRSTDKEVRRMIRLLDSAIRKTVKPFDFEGVIHNKTNEKEKK